MKTGYLSAILLSTAILWIVPYRGETVAVRHLERRFADAENIRTALLLSCSSLKPAAGTEMEKRFAEFFPLFEGPNRKPCVIRIRTEQVTRFHLLEFWHFLVYVTHENMEPVTAPMHWSSEFPRPLCLLPLIAFFLSIPFRISGFGIGLTSVLYLFLLAGMSPTQAVTIAWNSFGSAIETEKSVLGLIAISLWYALYVARYQTRTLLRQPSLSRNRMLSSLITGTIGLMNPAFFTLLAPIFSPWVKRTGRIRAFFSFQTALLAISLYFLAFNPRFPREIIESSLILPRYFTFATLFFLLFGMTFKVPAQINPIWELPKFKSIIFSILFIEGITYLLVWPKMLPTASRIGIALLATELFDFSPIDTSVFFDSARRTVAAVIVASFLTTLSIRSGITEMVILLWEPSARSTAVSLLTFLGGIGVGMVTGNFSATFFTLTPLVMKFQSAPLLRAALLDGILAGILLSPFSIFNLVPAAHYGIRLSNLILLRVRQLAVPLLIAFLIYGLGSIRAVGILRPVTFVFLCLIVFALRLKEANFMWERFWKTPGTEPEPQNR